MFRHQAPEIRVGSTKFDKFDKFPEDDILVLKHVGVGI
jgi:hypothetical protein